jgi:excisionase family DNA binding protein
VDAVRRDTLSVQEVAERLGISAATVRRKIKAGELHAVKWPTAQGFEWRVYPPGQADAHAPISDVQASINDVQVPTNDAYASINDMQVHVSEKTEMLHLIERLHQENVQLAGRIGWLESQLQQAQEQIRLLTAEKEPTEQPTSEPSPTTLMQHQEAVPTSERSLQGRVLRRFLRRLGIS